MAKEKWLMVLYEHDCLGQILMLLQSMYVQESVLCMYPKRHTYASRG